MTTVGALFRSTHPGPSLAVAAIAVVLGAGIGLDPWRIALLALAVLLGQFSVGLSNDWVDADRDRAVGRTEKPVAAGLVSLRTAQLGSLALLGVALALTVPLGWKALLAHLAFNGCGWAYNLSLKATPLSVAAYALGFGVLPAVVTLALPEPALPALWAVGAGALLGVSAHFANALPDLSDDRGVGVRGLPQILGTRWSVAIIALALVAGGLLVVLGPGTVDIPRLIGLATITVVAAMCWWLGVSRPPSRLLFQLILGAALAIVALLGFSGKLLLA